MFARFVVWMTSAVDVDSQVCTLEEPSPSPVPKSFSWFGSY